MASVAFYKMQGTGNDFIMIDNRSKRIKELARFAELYCARRTSVGADGAIFIEPASQPGLADFRMRYFNADGSEADMCGNGARCVSMFAYRLGIVKKQMAFETGAGIIRSEIIDQGNVRVQLTTPKDFRRINALALEGSTTDILSINTGVPHAVEFVSNVETVDIFNRGRALRRHDAFKPAGTNANFVQIVSETDIILRTYERGVEDETLACGTGATASALLTHVKTGAKGPIRVRVRSGETLTILFTATGSGDAISFKDVFLQGPVALVYKAELETDLA